MTASIVAMAEMVVVVNPPTNQLAAGQSPVTFMEISAAFQFFSAFWNLLSKEKGHWEI